ncbi:MAG: methylglyoxal synthase [Clostridia bacterium]|nr:methylglyoxal synthase [Clostridia bacterium]
MEIAFIASDSKKELITEFCMAYCGILSRHNLYATATTAKYIHAATGLEVESLFAGVHGGVQQLVSRINYNEIDILLYFRDPSSSEDYLDKQFDLVRACDAQSVPVATNIATAEALILSLDRGDLDWRMLVNPKYKHGQN